MGIGDDQSADTGNGLTQAHELLAVKLIGAAEVVDDFGNGFTGFGMALVVGQLVVLDAGAVFVLALGGSQIHAYAHSVYCDLYQAKYDKTCAYSF
jgi:hypothetical protein